MTEQNGNDSDAKDRVASALNSERDGTNSGRGPEHTDEPKPGARFEHLLLEQDVSEEDLLADEQLTAVSIGSPGKTRFFRVHPAWTAEVLFLDWQEEGGGSGDFYYVLDPKLLKDPGIRARIDIKRRRLFP